MLFLILAVQSPTESNNPLQNNNPAQNSEKSAEICPQTDIPPPISYEAIKNRAVSEIRDNDFQKALKSVQEAMAVFAREAPRLRSELRAIESQLISTNQEIDAIRQQVRENTISPNKELDEQMHLLIKRRKEIENKIIELQNILGIRGEEKIFKTAH